MQRFATELHLNYGPTDTSGARHGIMAAMQSRWQDDLKDDEDDSIQPASIAELADSKFESIIARMDRPRSRPSSIFFASKELGRLLTSQTRELLDFFADGLDGEPIFYQTKTGAIRIPQPLINLLGATTPGNLPSILPRDSHDHGLLSRIIFVYAGRSETSVPIPPAISTSEAALQSRMIEDLQRVTREARGDVKFGADAEDEYRVLYDYSVPTLEFRLHAYSGRRSDHLAKMAAILCLLRAESPYIINRRDVALAHMILVLTEMNMDGAYMGLDKTPEGRAYAIVREAIESEEPSSDERQIHQALLTRAGFKDDEISRCFERLILSKRLIPVQSGGKFALGGSIAGDKLRAYLDKLESRL